MINKMLKWVAIVISAIIILLVSAVIMGYYFNDRLTGYLINELNKNLDSKVRVEKVKFSFLDKFPHATLKFSNIIIYNPKSFKINNQAVTSDTLFFARSLSLQFDVLKLMKNQYEITRIYISNAVFKLRENEKGEFNTQIYKSAAKNDQSYIDLDLQLVNIESAIVRYAGISKWDINLFIQSYKLRGKFIKNNYQIAGTCKIEIFKVLENNKIYLSDKLYKTIVFIKHEINPRQISINDSWAKINGDKIAFEGVIDTKNNKIVNSRFTSDDLNIENVFKTIKPFYSPEFKSKGNLSLSAGITGNFSQLHLKASLTSEGSIIQFKDLPEIKCKFNAIAECNLNNIKDGKIKFANLDIYYKNNVLKTNILFVGLNPSQVNGSVNYNINLNDLQTINPGLKSISGNLVGNALFNFVIDPQNYKYENTLNSNFQLSAKSEWIKFSDSEFPEISFKNIEFKLIENIITGKCFVETGNQDAEIQKFQIPLKPLLKNRPEVLIKAKIKSSQFDLDKLISSIPETSDTTPMSWTYDVQAEISTDNFRYTDLIASDCKAILRFDYDKYDIDHFQANCAGGNVEGNLLFTWRKDNTSELNLHTMFYQTDINQLFNEFKNFDQETLKAENISGKMDGNLRFTCIFDKDYHLMDSTIQSQIQFKLAGGGLKNFEPLYKLARFVDLDELKNIRFSELKNTINIQKRVAIIPLMDLNSNLTKMTLYGEHSFDNQFNYHISIEVGSNMWKKSKHSRQKNTEFGIVQEDSLGMVTLYIQISGNSDDYKISFDKERQKIHIKEKVKEEKHLLKQIIREEFGKTKPDSSSLPKKPKSQFQIQWDELDDSIK